MLIVFTSGEILAPEKEYLMVQEEKASITIKTETITGPFDNVSIIFLKVDAIFFYFPV